MKKILISLVTICLLAGSCKGSVDTPEDTIGNEEDVLADVSLSDNSGKQIPILAWGGIDRHSSASMYQDLADAGFTINYPYDLSTEPDASRANLLFPALDKAAAAGVKQLIGAAWLDYLSPQDVERLKAHPGLAGYWFYDEPTKYEQIETLKAWVDRVKLIDNEHLLYINLAGCDCRGANWAPELVGCTGSEPSPCARFVKTFADEVDIPMISVDRYTVNIDPITKQRRLMPGWYYTLELMRREAERTGKDLWSFALSTEHSVSGITYPIPTMSDLRLQMYSNLAYGAQTLQYYTYIHRPWDGYGQAPLAEDGSKTSTYYLIQEMNKELIALSPVFLDAKVKWVAHTGVVPDGTEELDKSKLPPVFKSLDITGGSGALVSFLEKGEDNFLVVVNHDVSGTVSVKATGSGDLFRVNKQGKPVLLGNNAQALAPGDVCIYFWKK